MHRCGSYLFVASLLFMLLTPGAAISSDGVNSCGYEMMVVPVQIPAALEPATTPGIVDAWTTNDPFGNPWSEVYNFTAGQGLLGLVVEYNHAGGTIPEQASRGWICGDETQVAKTCRFKWTVPLPPGTYLLINFLDPVPLGNTEFDWAAKVGDVVFGWPDISATRPWCFSISRRN